MRYALVITLLLVTARAEAGRGTALLRYLSDDTTTVIVADVSRARSSPVFKKLFQLAREQDATFDALASDTSFEKSVDTIVLGANASAQAIVVFEGRIDKLLATVKKNSTKTETHAGVTYWVTNDGEVAVVDKKLVFATAGTITAVIDRAKKKKAKGPSVARTIIAATRSGTAVFGGSMLDAARRSELGKALGAEPQWLAFSLAMGQKLTFDARVKLASDADAAKAAKTVNDQLTPERRGQVEGLVGKEFSDSITVDQQHAFMRLGASMTAGEVDKLIALAKVLL